MQAMALKVTVWNAGSNSSSITHNTGLSQLSQSDCLLCLHQLFYRLHLPSCLMEAFSSYPVAHTKEQQWKRHYLSTVITSNVRDDVGTNVRTKLGFISFLFVLHHSISSTQPILGLPDWTGPSGLALMAHEKRHVTLTGPENFNCITRNL